MLEIVYTILLVLVFAAIAWFAGFAAYKLLKDQG